MPVIEDHAPFGLGIMPDHACDRGAARLDPGASRSQAYQTRSGHGPSDSKELTSARRPKAWRRRGVSVDVTKLGARDQNYLLTANSKSLFTSTVLCRKRHVC